MPQRIGGHWGHPTRVMDQSEGGRHAYATKTDPEEKQLRLILRELQPVSGFCQSARLAIRRYRGYENMRRVVRFIFLTHNGIGHD